jgi:hypothetical protein
MQLAKVSALPELLDWEVVAPASDEDPEPLLDGLVPHAADSRTKMTVAMRATADATLGFHSRDALRST